MSDVQQIGQTAWVLQLRAAAENVWIALAAFELSAMIEPTLPDGRAASGAAVIGDEILERRRGEGQARHAVLVADGEYAVVWGGIRVEMLWRQSGRLDTSGQFRPRYLVARSLGVADSRTALLCELGEYGGGIRRAWICDVEAISLPEAAADAANRPVLGFDPDTASGVRRVM